VEKVREGRTKLHNEVLNIFVAYFSLNIRVIQWKRMSWVGQMARVR